MSRLIVAILFVAVCYAQEVELDSKRLHTLFVHSPLYKEMDIALLLAKNRLLHATSALDVHMKVEADNKEYPLSDAKYLSALLQKRLLLGANVSAGYRYAKGVQEYNNIKTGSRGEYIAGVELSLLEIVKNLSQTFVAIKNTKLDIATKRQQLRAKRLDLWQRVQEAYYTARFAKSRVAYLQKILENMQKLQKMVQRRVQEGSLAKIALDEINVQVAARKQLLLRAQTDLQQSRNLLAFLLDTKEYLLPPLSHFSKELLAKREACKIALANSPKLHELSFQNKRAALQKEALFLSRASLKVGLYGVQDLLYQDGYKATLKLDVPLGQRQWRAKKEQISLQKMQIAYQKKIEQSNIKRRLEDIYSAFTQEKALNKVLQEQVRMRENLYFAEKKRFLEGVGTLFMLLQREQALLQDKLSLLQNRYKLWMLYVQYERILAKR